MAQLKSTLVTGDLAVTGNIYGNGEYLKNLLTKVDGITKSGSTIIRYGVCDTAAATAAKAASLTSGTATLSAGLAVYVKFSYDNTANSPTLNIGGTGAANIYFQGVQITDGDEKELLKGMCLFVYDGTNYHLVGGGGGGGAAIDIYAGNTTLFIEASGTDIPNGDIVQY